MSSLSSPLKSPGGSGATGGGAGGSNTLSTVRALRASPQKTSPYKVASLLSSAVGSTSKQERSPVPVDASELQWYTLLEAIRNGRKSAKRALRGMADGQLLENLVTTMASDTRSDALKCNLLVRRFSPGACASNICQTNV